MIYRVFANQAALDAANAAWAAARHAADVHDVRAGQPIEPGITERWDSGRAMLDGRIACQVPTHWADVFGGEAVDLSEDAFPVAIWMP